MTVSAIFQAMSCPAGRIRGGKDGMIVRNPVFFTSRRLRLEEPSSFGSGLWARSIVQAVEIIMNPEDSPGLWLGDGRGKPG